MSRAPPSNEARDCDEGILEACSDTEPDPLLKEMFKVETAVLAVLCPLAESSETVTVHNMTVIVMSSS